MDIRSVAIRGAALLFASVALGSIAQSQCQDQLCQLNPQTRCFQCVAGGGMACATVHAQKCSKSCEDTVCGATGDVSDQTAKCLKPSVDQVAALQNPRD